MLQVGYSGVKPNEIVQSKRDFLVYNLNIKIGSGNIPLWNKDKNRKIVGFQSTVSYNRFSDNPLQPSIMVFLETRFLPMNLPTLVSWLQKQSARLEKSEFGRNKHISRE